MNTCLPLAGSLEFLPAKGWSASGRFLLFQDKRKAKTKNCWNHWCSSL